MATSENISTARPFASLRGWLSSQRNFQRLQQILIFIIMVIGAIAMIAPFEWMLATSFSRSANIAMPRIPTFWPADPSFFNYKVAITNLPLVRYYFNSLLVTAASTLGYLFFSSLTGYAFAKCRFVGKSVLFIILLTTLMIPFEIRMIPMYQLMRQLHLSDSYAALILRSEEHTSELQSQSNLVCRLLLEKKKNINKESSVILIDLIPTSTRPRTSTF